MIISQGRRLKQEKIKKVNEKIRKSAIEWLVLKPRVALNEEKKAPLLSRLIR